MPTITLDLRDARSLKPIPGGTYTLAVESISEPQQGAKAVYVTWVFRVIDDEDYEGRLLYHNTPINGAGAGIFADLYGKLTKQEIDVDELEELEIDLEDLIGEEILAAVVEDEYEGRPKNEIKRFMEA